MPSPISSSGSDAERAEQRRRRRSPAGSRPAAGRRRAGCARPAPGRGAMPIVRPLPTTRSSRSRAPRPRAGSRSGRGPPPAWPASSSTVCGSVAGRARSVWSRSATVALVTRIAGDAARRRAAAPGARIVPARPPRAWLRLSTLPSGSASARVAERAPRSMPRIAQAGSRGQRPDGAREGDGRQVHLVRRRTGDLAQQLGERARAAARAPRARASGRGLATLDAAPGSNSAEHLVGQVRRPGPDDRPCALATGGGNERRGLQRPRAARCRRSRRR